MPSDYSVVSHRWVKSDWWYVGNGNDESVNEMSGTVVLDKEERAVKFFF
jgi:hypothetical protein